MQRLFFVLNCLRSLQWVILPFDETLPGHVGAPLDFAEMRCVNTQPCQHICLDDSRQPTLAFKKACGGCRQARDLHTRAVLSCPGSRFLIAKKTIYLPSFFFMNWATDETKKKKNQTADWSHSLKYLHARQYICSPFPNCSFQHLHCNQACASSYGQFDSEISKRKREGSSRFRLCCSVG